MSDSFRRFEILLPRRFNDGRAVPDEFIADTLLELRTQFGAISSETQTILGQWQQEDQLYRDELVRLFLDVPDTVDNLQFFIDYKETLKTRFDQRDIWITTYLIEAL